MRMGEIEQPVEAAGESVERPVADALAAEPVVFDEAQDRGLVGEVVVYGVDSAVGAEDQQRLPWSIAAAVLIPRRGRAGAAQAVAGQGVLRTLAVVNDRA